MIYLVDGYNVVHASPALRAIADVNFESARDALAEMAAAVMGPNDTVRIIFDGRGTKLESAPSFPGVHGLETVFAPAGTAADTVIERAVYRAVDRSVYIVVTADGGIRDLCRGLGAMVITPEAFEQKAREAAQAARNHAHNHLPGAPGRGLAQRLDEASQERLSALRDELARDEKDDKRRR